MSKRTAWREAGVSSRITTRALELEGDDHDRAIEAGGREGRYCIEQVTREMVMPAPLRAIWITWTTPASVSSSP